MISGGVLLIELAGLEGWIPTERTLLGQDLLMEASASIGPSCASTAVALHTATPARSLPCCCPTCPRARWWTAPVSCSRACSACTGPSRSIWTRPSISVPSVIRPRTPCSRCRKRPSWRSKSARLQGHSGWFLYEKSLDEEQEQQGDGALAHLINRPSRGAGSPSYLQPVQQERDQVVLQLELLIRIRDEQGGSCGGSLHAHGGRRACCCRWTRLVVAQTLRLLRQRPESSCPVCLSLSAQNLLSREFQRGSFLRAVPAARSLNEG